MKLSAVTTRRILSRTPREELPPGWTDSADHEPLFTKPRRRERARPAAQSKLKAKHRLARKAELNIQRVQIRKESEIQSVADLDAFWVGTKSSKNQYQHLEHNPIRVTPPNTEWFFSYDQQEPGVVQVPRKPKACWGVNEEDADSDY